MRITIDNANKLLSVIISTITEDDDYFTIEDENLQVFKETLLTAIDTMRKYQQMQVDYETRLKADMVAMLTDIQLEIEELDTPNNGSAYMDCAEIIQQKIDALKEVEE
jgi:hypothetical protein